MTLIYQSYAPFPIGPVALPYSPSMHIAADIAPPPNADPRASPQVGGRPGCCAQRMRLSSTTIAPCCCVEPRAATPQHPIPFWVQCYGPDCMGLLRNQAPHSHSPIMMRHRFIRCDLVSWTIYLCPPSRGPLCRVRASPILCESEYNGRQKELPLVGRLPLCKLPPLMCLPCLPGRGSSEHPLLLAGSAPIGLSTPGGNPGPRAAPPRASRVCHGPH